MSGASVKPSLVMLDAVVLHTRVGEEYQVDTFPTIGGALPETSGAAGDNAELIWAPSEPEDAAAALFGNEVCDPENGMATSPIRSGHASSEGEASSASSSAGGGLAVEHAVYLRRWAAVELQDAALEALWRHNGWVSSADRVMEELQASHGFPRRPQAEAARSAALGAAIICARKDMLRAKRALNASGFGVSIGELQHFFYGTFRQSSEYKMLSAATKAEQEADGFDDFCHACGLRGLLICCDGCGAVYHLYCVGLEVVPEGDWKCPTCAEGPPKQTKPPPKPAPSAGAASAPPTAPPAGAKSSPGKAAEKAPAAAEARVVIPPFAELPGLGVGKLKELAIQLQVHMGSGWRRQTGTNPMSRGGG